jgi:hypothetical protein
MKSPSQSSPRPQYYTPGGALKPTAPSYVMRAADHELPRAIRNGQYCYILTPRQMGKSSLMVRTATQLQPDIRSVMIDLTQIGTSNVTPDEWYLGHLKRIRTQLKMRTDYGAWWRDNKHLSVVQRFVTFIAEMMLKEISTPITIYIDEIDTTLRLNFSDDYFAAIRSLYNARTIDSALDRVTFVLLGVASPSELIKDQVRTPFNIGTRIWLTDFTPQEAGPLLPGLGADRTLARLMLDRVLEWTGGHPYLTQKVCREVAQWSERRASIPLDLTEAQAEVEATIRRSFFSDEGRNSDTNLQFVRTRILEHPDSRDLLSLYRKVLRREPVPDDERDPIRNELKLTGIVKNGGDGLLVSRNRIYDRVFDELWVRRSLGEAQEQPQRKEPWFSRLFGSAASSREPEYKYDVYLSYSRRDEGFVLDVLLPTLASAGLRVFTPASVPAGAAFSDAVETGIADSRAFIAIVSPDYVVSESAQDELHLAIDLQSGKAERHIIPVMIKDARLPLGLAHYQYLDLTTDRDDGLRRLLATLGVTRRAEPSDAAKRRTARPTAFETADVRRLLEDAFDEDDLNAIAYDLFRPIYASVESAATKKSKVQNIIKHLEMAGSTDQLLDHIARNYPDAYRRFARRVAL